MTVLHQDAKRIMVSSGVVVPIREGKATQRAQNSERDSAGNQHRTHWRVSSLT